MLPTQLISSFQKVAKILKPFLVNFQLSSEARERAVPSTRIGRLVTFGGLGLGNN